MTTRKKLRDELTKSFIPALNQRGFNGPAAIRGRSTRIRIIRVSRVE